MVMDRYHRQGASVAVLHTIPAIAVQMFTKAAHAELRLQHAGRVQSHPQDAIAVEEVIILAIAVQMFTKAAHAELKVQHAEIMFVKAAKVHQAVRMIVHQLVAIMLQYHPLDVSVALRFIILVIVVMVLIQDPRPVVHKAG